MASKIQGYKFYVAITPYRVEGVEDQYNELSVYADYSQYVHQFYVSLHAGWTTTYGHGSMIMGGQDPLTASIRVQIKESPKNSQKYINEMGTALEVAKADIAWLFDQRMWPELQQFVKDVALCGYTSMLEERIKGYKNFTTVAAQVNAANNENQNNKEDKDMTTTFKAADLIGKTIILGATGAKYVVKSVNGDKLECDFSNGKATIPMGVPVSQAEKFLASGTWKIEGAIANENENENENKPAAPETRNLKPETKDMSIRTEADVAEVDDIMPKVTPSVKAKPNVNDNENENKPAPKVKVKVKTNLKPETKVKPETKPQTSAVSPQTSKGKLTYSTYDVVKKNKETGEDYTVQNAKIAGFDLTDAAYLAGASFNGGLLPETIDGKQVGTLRFSYKWREAAKAICDKLNAGGTVQDCVAIIEQAKADRKQKINERIQKRAERKAKREERKAAAEAESKVKGQRSKAETKVYTQAELAEWLRKLNAGDEEAAKFFNDLAKAA